MMSQIGNAANIINQPNTRAVNNVKWHMQNDQVVHIENIPNNETNLVFIRPNDGHTNAQQNVNIAVNDRYQVSLQAGHFTQVRSCVGINRLSTVITGAKTNDLLANASEQNLAGGATYFYQVNLDGAGNTSLTNISPEVALQLLQGKKEQSHQISRVVPNCPTVSVIKVEEDVVPLNPIVQEPPELPLTEAVTMIELSVLFDTDKSIIKPRYYQKIDEVVDFLNQQPNTNAVIEGHTDSRASESYNQALSQRRAEAVRQALIERGIDPARLTAIGYGESRPVASNATPAGRQQNRRVIVIIK